jgi:hypothetical protein
MRVTSLAYAALALTAPVNALFEDLTIESDGRPAFHVDSFGFKQGGQVVRCCCANTTHWSLSVW